MLMNRIRRVAQMPRDAATADQGISLIEVMVALMIFMIVSVGLVYSLTAALRINRDSVDREVAANLAATEIDSVRSVSDPFTVYSKTYTTSVSGKQYTITRSAGWVPADGSTGNCGTGSTGANIQYKRVNVSVDWVGRSVSTPLATSSTILAPATRINDPDKGTLLVSTITAAGSGAAGIAVTLTPTLNGAPATMAATDSDGCSYGLGLTAGTYTVKVSKTGYISADQQTAPARSITIAAGATSSVQFQYDQAATFTLKYASNLSGSVLKPSTFTTVFNSTYGNYSLSGMPSTVSLHPFASGYTTIAGAFVPATAAGDGGVPAANPGCLSPDPSQWAASGTKAAGVRSDPVAATPGGSATINIPMGQVTVPAPGSGVTIVATNATPLAGSGDPGCSTVQSYTFTTSGGGDQKLALPYGTWTIQKRSVLNVLTPITGLVGGLVGTGSTANVITLDPRPDA